MGEKVYNVYCNEFLDKNGDVSVFDRNRPVRQGTLENGVLHCNFARLNLESGVVTCDVIDEIHDDAQLPCQISSLFSKLVDTPYKDPVDIRQRHLQPEIGDNYGDRKEYQTCISDNWWCKKIWVTEVVNTSFPDDE